MLRYLGLVTGVSLLLTAGTYLSAADQAAAGDAPATAPVSTTPSAAVAAADAHVDDAYQGLWVQDFAAAQAQAKAEGKDLLIDFTGSDWCDWCIKLHEEVFTHASFMDAIQKDFILVELDYPREKEQGAEIKAQNALLQEKYAIRGYPTVLLADHTGAVYGRTGYQAGGPEKYLAHVLTFKAAQAKRAADLAAAEKLDGMEKVEKLGAVLNSLIDSGIEDGQEVIVKQIKALDADDSKGFIAAYEFPKKLAVIEEQINKDRDFDKALTSLNDLLVVANNAEQKQHIYIYMAGIYAQGKGDMAQAMSYYQMAADALPESDLAKNIYQALERQKQEKQDADAAAKTAKP